jgi:raffinose/stachyose/melibiose transport system permease protein
VKGTLLGSVGRHSAAYFSAFIFIIPIYILINLSVREATDLSPAFIPTAQPTAQNFIDAWTLSDLGLAILNSAIVTTASSIVILVLATMAAYPLARSTSRLSTATFYLFLIGLLLPFQVATLPLYVQFRDLGLLGNLWGLVLFYVGTLMPFSVFLVTTFLRTGVATEYEEAARIDGASDTRVFRVIVMPLLTPVLGTLAILNGVSIWNDFFTPLLYLAGTNQATIPVALYDFVGVYSTKWPLIFAGLIISMLPILVIFIIFQRYIIHGFAGGLKG